MTELYPVNPRIQKQIDLFKKSRLSSRMPMLFLDIPAYKPHLFTQPFKALGLERQMLNALKEKFGIELPTTILQASVYVELVKSINRAATYFPNLKKEPSPKAIEYLTERGLTVEAYLAFNAGDKKALSVYFKEGHPSYESHKYFVMKRSTDLDLSGLASQGAVLPG